MSSEIYPRFASQTAGRLTKIRAQAVSGPACAEVAGRLGLPEMLRTAAPADANSSIEALLATPRVLASVVEAVIGACYLAHGWEPAAEAVIEAFADQIDFAAENVTDFKSALQERLARGGDTVTYRVVREQGPPHNRRFEVVAEAADRVLGRGEGRSKKAAEQAAASRALEELET